MRRHLALRVVAGAAVVLTAAAACGGSSTKNSGSSAPSSSSSSGGGQNTASAPGVTATSVLIGSGQPLTGPAAPGYSEIAPASKAYFDYVNAHGGVNGRKINYKYLDDAYDPTKEGTVIKQLVLQDQVFAVFNDLGTPTHLQSVGFLNQNKVPDLFVASGCSCWNETSQHPYTYGWQTDYIREGKILGQYIKQHFAGKKVGYFYQNDDFGQDGVKGLDMELPASMVVSKQPYDVTQTDVSPQVQKLQAAGAQVVASFSIPAFTALLKLSSLAAGYNPQLVVSSVGADPNTLSGLLQSFAKQGGKSVQGNQLIQGLVTAGYIPSAGDASDAWIKLFQQIRQQYAPSLPWDGNVEYGMAVAYTFVAALKAAGQNPTRQSLIDAVNANSGLGGPGLVPFAYSKTDHDGYTGEQVGTISGSTVVYTGQPETTDNGSGAINNVSSSETPPPASGVPGS